MKDIMRRNFRREKATHNRYVTDSRTYWREELHPRIDNIKDELIDNCNNIITQKITDNVWGFPVDFQSLTNTKKVFEHIISDYFNFVGGRRTWVYTEVDGYWTEEKIANTISYALIMCLWDNGKQLLVDNYPLVADDLRHRSGVTSSNDKRETYHDSINKIGTDDERYTEHDNEKNAIHEHSDSTGSDTMDSRSTNNSTTVSDIFQSPQDIGVLPSSQSDNIMNRFDNFQKPETHGVEELKPNGDPKYTTGTSNTFEGITDTGSDGKTYTSNTGHNRVDEMGYLEGSARTGSDAQAENNIGAKEENDTGTERKEVLDISGVLQSFYDIFKDRLMMEIDNRMTPYYLHMKISRFEDHGIGRGYYV